MTCIGNSGPLPEAVVQAVDKVRGRGEGEGEGEGEDGVGEGDCHCVCWMVVLPCCAVT